MLFQSLSFLCVFLPVSLVLYYGTPRRYRNAAMLCVSAAFYLLGEPYYAVFAAVSLLLDYWLGRGIERYRGDKRARRLMTAGILKDGAFLLLVKHFTGFPSVYYGSYPLLGLLIPLGLVVYTLKSVSYLVDVYRGDAPCEYRLTALGTYLLFFPALPFGPVLLYRDFAKQLDPEQRKTSAGQFVTGGWFFCMGLTKVLLISGNFAQLWESFSGQLGQGLTFLSAVVGLLCVTMALYFLWSGSVDMAKGLSNLFGFSCPKTENYPFMARNLTAFLCRLDTGVANWLQTYAYSNALTSGNTLLKWIVNIILFFLFKGFFVGDMSTLGVWVLMLGLFILFDRILYRYVLSRAAKAIQHLYTLLGILSCCLVFALPDTHSLRLYVLALCNVSGIVAFDPLLDMLVRTILLLFAAGAIFAVSGFFQKAFRKLYELQYRGVPVVLAPAQLVLLTLCLAYLF